MGELVFIGLGSNVGQRIRNIDSAIEQISRKCGQIFRTSNLYETEPWGRKDQGPFVNQVIEIETCLQPRELLHQCQHIEYALKRRRLFRWGPRIIDIDILLFGERIYDEEDLIIPHPRLTERRFVLIPLADLVPDLMIPGIFMTVKDCLEQCRDSGKVTFYSAGAMRRNL